MSLIARLSSHYFLAGLSLGIFVAVQTLFLQDKGFDLTQIGLLFGAYASATTLLELPLGALADRYGRLRLYAWSRALTLLAALVCLVGTEFEWLWVGLALAGIGRALDSGSIQAWQVEAFQAAHLDEQLDASIARFHSATALGLASGAILGGYLPVWLGPFWHQQPASQWNLLCQAALTAGHLLLLPWLFREGETDGDRSSSVKLGLILHQALGLVRTHTRIRTLVWVAWVIGLMLFALETYWQAQLRSLVPSANYALFGWLSSGYFMAAVLGPWLLSLLMHRANGYGLAFLLGLVALMLALLALQHQLPGFAMTYLGFMLCLSMLNVPLETLLVRSAPTALRASLFSLVSLAVQLGGLTIAYGASWLLPWLGIAGLWWLIATIAAFTLPLLPWLLRENAEP